MSSEDLNGTARFVGMGGAMGALGADMSVMGTNPAGIGLYRRSEFALSGGFNRQIEGESFRGHDALKASFDNIGFVYSVRTGGGSVPFLNFGFNYHKKKNFAALFGGNVWGLDQLPGGLSGMSQSWEMADLAYVGGNPLDLTIDNDGNMNPDFDKTTPVTGLGAMTQMIEPTYDTDGKLDGYNPSYAASNSSHVARWGGIEQYDFNFSANVKDRFYVGLTLGAYHVNWHSVTGYGEKIMDGAENLYDYSLSSEESITGSGFDVKAGVIVRPVEESAFRIGLSVSSPTFYDLTHSGYAYMVSPYVDADGNNLNNDVEVSPHDYRIRTPWKVNLSLGHTVGTYLAIGAEYEYANYSKAKISYANDGYYDGGYFYGGSGSDDVALNNETKRFLKGVHTFRIGAEAKLYEGLFARVGYNFVSAPMKDDAYNNLFTDSPSYYYSVSTDYLNLGSTNRYTAGLGYRGQHFYVDLAYQYQAQKGTYYAFHVPESSGSERNALAGLPVKLDRHQMIFTVGYKF